MQGPCHTTGTGFHHKNLENVLHADMRIRRLGTGSAMRKMRDVSYSKRNGLSASVKAEWAFVYNVGLFISRRFWKSELQVPSAVSPRPRYP